MMPYKRLGRNVSIFPEAQLIYPENVCIGDESMIDGHCFIYAAGEGIEIGKFCHVTVGSHLQSGGLLKMEDFSACGAQCIIMAASDNYLGEGFIGLKVFGDKYRKMDFRPVTLKRHAHVGAGTIILPGVTIGEGCSVGAGSIVTRDLPPWTICVGSPARPIKNKPKDKQLAMEKEFLAEYKAAHPLMVSICCLTYNHENFIEAALDSFLMQKTSFNFEVLVHDDASTDRTPEILRKYAAKYEGIIKPIFQKENQFSKTGVYPIAEFVYPLAKGKYIAECDGDDYWTDPLKLQKQVDYLEENPDFVLTYHDFEIRGNGSAPIKGVPVRKDYSSEELIAIPLGGYNIATSTKVFRNLYGPATKRDFENFCGDYPLTVLLGLHGKCKFIEGISPSVYRKHAHNSWGGLPHAEMAKRTKEMHRRLYELMVEKGNPRHIALRRKFL